jgi:hypothetical protein
MKPALRIGLLVLSHGLVFALGAGEMAGWLTMQRFARAGDDPRYRISVHFTLDDPERPPTTFEQDLASIEKQSPAPTAGVLRLLGHLRGVDSGGKPQYAEASKDCVALDWPKCDEATLKAMRKEAVP